MLAVSLVSEKHFFHQKSNFRLLRGFLNGWLQRQLNWRVRKCRKKSKCRNLWKRM
uniref:Uncharacterized protein n=1 Tax=Rhizophora mucronata TaxID=61149 RepID=A0A2P2JEC3_RHIMU